MDPVTAVGLATNVAQLVELSWKVVSKSHELYRNGVLPEHRDTETVTADLRKVNDKLLVFLDQTEKAEGLGDDDDDEALRVLCESSNRIATELIKRLQQIKPGDEHRSWKSIRQALKSVWIKGELDETAARLQAYRLQLNTRILVTLRDKIDRLHQNTENIATNISQNRVLFNTNQEIQTEYLTRLIASQHDKTRELLNSLMLASLPAYSPVSTPTNPQIKDHEQHDPRTAIFQAVEERSLSKLRHALRADPSVVFAFNDVGQTALHLASRAGDEELVEYLIRNGARINPDDDDGLLPLHYAVQSQYLAVVRALLAKGADPQAKDNEGRTPQDLCAATSLIRWMLTHGPNIEMKNEGGMTALYYFTCQGDYDAVRTLLDLGADIETVGHMQKTPIFEPAEYGQVDLIELLLSHRAAVNKADHRRDTPLLRAAWHGHTRTAELLLDAGAEIDAANQHGFTALDECCAHGRTETGRLLVQRGAKMDRFTLNGYAPLHHAAKEGHFELVEAILDQGGDVNILHPRVDWTALAEACWHGHFEIAKLLVKHGAAIETPTGDDRKTALLRAATGGWDNIVEHLIDHVSANIEATDSEGRTPLACAVQERKLRAAQALIQRRANIDAPQRHLYTPLCLAAQNTHLEMVQMLVAAGADLHARNADDWTALHEVSARGHAPIAQILLEYGADPNVRTDLGYTPLGLAVIEDHYAVVHLILESKRAHIDLTNNDGWSPLHEASSRDRLEIARALLEHGADPHVRDKDGFTPLNRAAQHGRLRVVTLLLVVGKANVNAASKNGWTPLHEASWSNNVELTRVLLDHGARTDLPNNSGELAMTLAQARKHSRIIPLLK